MMYKPLMWYAAGFHRTATFTAIMDFVKQLDTRLVLIITWLAAIKLWVGGIKFNDQLILELCGSLNALGYFGLR